MDSINILYASDDNYAPIAGISITSLLENNKDIDNLHIWFLADNISRNNIDNLQKTVKKYSRTITFLDAEDSLTKVKEMGADSWFGGSFSAYSRLFLQEYLGDKKIDRILYLDCDTIVVQGIDKLWNYNLDGKTIGMVCDYVGAGIREVIGLKSTDKYYNSGVLLIDMNLWKNHKCQEKIIWHMKNINACYPFIDQDIINIALKDEIRRLPWNWNVFPYYYTYSFKNIQKQYDLNAINQYSKKEYEKGLTKQGKPDAMILHYTATFYGKPWYANSCDPTKDIWRNYYKISCWNGTYPLLPLKLNYIERLSRIIVNILPQSLYLYIFRYFSRKYMNTLKQARIK